MMIARKTVGCFLILVFVLSCQLNSTAQRRVSKTNAWEALLYYQSADLTKLEKKDANKVRFLLNQVIANRKDSRLTEFQVWLPWFLWRMQSRGDRSMYVLLEAGPLMTIPGQSKARIHFFSNEGEYLSNSEFLAGHRLDLKDARIIRETDIGYPMIEISTEPVINGRETARQYYALKGTHVCLVRLETAEAKVLRNEYWAPNLTVGPPITSRSVTNWKEALDSADLTAVLQALVWLGGVHRDTRREHFDSTDIPYEDIKDAKLVETIRLSSEIRTTLEELAKSEKRWVREAAELALKPVSEFDHY